MAPPSAGNSAVDAISRIAGLDQSRTKSTVPLLTAAAFALGESDPMFALFEPPAASRTQFGEARLSVITSLAIVVVQGDLSGAWAFSMHAPHPEGEITLQVTSTTQITGWDLTLDKWNWVDIEPGMPGFDGPFAVRIHYADGNIELNVGAGPRPSASALADLMGWLAAGHPQT